MKEPVSYRRMKLQAGALLVCLAGLLTVSVLHILDRNTERVLDTHARQTAVSWASYYSEVTPQIETILQTGLTSANIVEHYREAIKLNHIKRFTLLNTRGHGIYTYAPQQDVQNGSVDPLRPMNAQLASLQPEPRAIERDPAMLRTAIAPLVENGVLIGALHLVVDQSHLNSVFLQAIRAGGWDILTLLVLILLACCFMYLILAKIAQDHAEVASRIDDLTSLPTRKALSERLTNVLAGNTDNAAKTAVVAIKVDRFRELNELLGAEGADEILCEFARRLNTLAGTNGYAARMSGNTFGMMMSNLNSASEVSQFTEQAIKVLAEPFSCCGKHIQPKASIGVSLSPDDGVVANTLIEQADIARFIAKEHGGNQLTFYDPETASKFARKHELENVILGACEEQSFELYYQPLYNLESRQLTGFEALIRLPDGDGGMIPPDQFIPAAEAMRKIGEIGTWVLFEACRTASNWPKSVSVAVNLSPLQFESGTLINDVKQALELSGLEPERLEVEITEGLMLDNSEEVRDQLDELQALGINIALDDFGTGYSSLNYLWRFPFDRIKVDRSFVAGMSENEQAKGILKTIVSLAATMNVPITAEGIETKEQLAYLTTLGCQLGQGYLLGRPQPDTDVSVTLIKNFQIAQPAEPQEMPDIAVTPKLAIAR